MLPVPAGAGASVPRRGRGTAPGRTGDRAAPRGSAALAPQGCRPAVPPALRAGGSRIRCGVGSYSVGMPDVAPAPNSAPSHPTTPAPPAVAGDGDPYAALHADATALLTGWTSTSAA